MKKERQECIIYQRTCGWMSPQSAMNKGKIAEVRDRKFYKIDNAFKFKNE